MLLLKYLVIILISVCLQVLSATSFIRSLQKMWSRPLISPEANMTTVEMIRHRGYRVQVHQVITEDFYILNLHRLLPPSGFVQYGKVVYLQHGMVATDHIWIMNPTDQALAYMLVDRGYDVWLGNSRGTENSRSHVFLDPNESEYWQFGWDEMGKYDIPASIRYILAQTHRKRLVYVGHSLGSTLFFISMIQHPELNKSVELMIGLAPVSSVANLRGMMLLLAKLPVSLLEMKTKAFLSYRGSLFSQKIQRNLCDRTLFGSYLCRAYIFSIFGYNHKDFNMSSVSVINGHYPAGASFRTITHLFQNYRSGEKFLRFNYGLDGNLEHYGTPYPPAYDLSRVTAPVYLYYGDNDPLATPKDVWWLASKLGNVRECVRIQDPKFSHGDFFWSTRAAELVYSSVLDRIQRPLSKSLILG